ncbi:poly(ADP-ribose) glycohydrolase 1 isoform X2 [Canna indica]|uniref:poly(ADP-ribose) glycohydrolase n=1 Tax=Canna indica TaxID=4628 RepID=A0AAQ3K7N3_9LILI|nr:poly(ADP-ribose) glycohydrolase 1 isoform X2 [Canna indica]
METRGDLDSVLPFLPLILRSSALFWPSQAIEALRALALGPDVSRVRSGEVLFDAILDLRDYIGLSSQNLARGAASGFSLFFDELMSKMDSRLWFDEVVPEMARLLLRLPSLLEAHYLKSDELLGEGKFGLRIMGPEEPGIVFLHQELIAALLSCAMFCLFPTGDRGFRGLPIINFDCLFASLHRNGKQSQVQKIRCLVHYFERISLKMPTGYVSFERKVLPLENSNHGIVYPTAASWSTSTLPLCSFEIFSSGLIEDQSHEAIEVDFANEYLGGGALGWGCVQEEIRFMINPELIIGMLFMTAMGDNEAIEIVGVERFSCYTGYGSSFQFTDDYQDNKPYDSMGRRKTRIVAIDALCSPRMRQYEVGCLVREANKALCGFLDQPKFKRFFKAKDTGNSENGNKYTPEGNSENKISQVIDSQDSIGIATGNWGCGAFGGDPEIKSIIQWLGASQGLRPFIHYYTFGEEALLRLEELTRWILQHGWTVGDLWSMLVEYSDQRLNGETNLGFFAWLLPPQQKTSDAIWKCC